MVLCRKNRPCGLKFSGGGGGGSGGCTGGQATAPVVSQQLPAGCGLQAHLAAKQGSNQRLSGSGLHEFHSLAGKQQSTANGNSEDCDDEAAMETAQLPNVGPTCVLPHLYIGSQADALDAEVMQRFGITHVINVSISCPQSQHVPDSNFLRIPVNDGYTDKLLPHFQRAFSFLERVRESSGRCLVHCLAGISRSPTLSIAYIMKHRCMSQDEAYRFVKQRRRHISPNFNFLGQLLEFERQLRRSGEAAAAGERPEAKRQRTSDRSPTSALSQLSFGVLPTVGSEIMVRRPRSVLIQGDGFVGGGISGPIWEQPVRRSRSSDAFLDLEDEAVRSCEETAVGPVACLS
ncbi:hypothetical protein BOX15_Mlig009817g1 [Macrostomum lignano]|uniref:Uncharacterized protein n=2 Tax=Macrostomum lignano TaxID=282301 RepID=A0A267DFX0_9PLAT|nr:hypothetical protein BOX15_Mlig009817g2 [Macrostomum lignano]PAA50023.1 hypothetical protein BOX15_Mlig009817g1 [Macrostomum lignano]